MEPVFVLGVAASTSLAIFLVCRQWLRFTSAGLRRAVGQTLETVGLSILFYALNVLCGVGLALLMRNVGSTFVSLYVNTDASLMVFAALQGLIVELWRRSEQSSRP
jgi:hypothetical protein